MPKARTALEQALLDLWEGPQNLIGLARGYLRTGETPRQGMDPQGNREFRFTLPDEDPLSVGSTITSPSDIDPESLAHERVHLRQSRELGPAYIPLRVIGELMSRFDAGDPYIAHPLEDEAYLETASTPNLATRLSLLQGYRKRK